MPPIGSDRCIVGGLVDLAQQEVGEAGLAFAGTSFEAHGERFRAAPGQRVEDLLDRRAAVAVALGAGLHLGDRLRAAQDEDREHRQLGRRHPPALVGGVAVADRAPAVRRMHEPNQPHRLEREQRGLDRAVVVRHDGMPVGRLVARQTQRVERQRIAVGGRRLLLDEAGEYPRLLTAQRHGCGAQPSTAAYAATTRPSPRGSPRRPPSIRFIM